MVAGAAGPHRVWWTGGCDPRVCDPRVCDPRVCDPRVCDPKRFSLMSAASATASYSQHNRFANP